MPVSVAETMLPFRLRVALPVILPFPSKVSVPTPASGPAMAGGAVVNPVPMCAKVPFRLALEHPLLSAFAVGATARASAVTAAIAKFFARVLRFMMISFTFINFFPSDRPSFRSPVLFRKYRRKRTAKPATVCAIFLLTSESRPSINAPSAEITILLRAWSGGDEAALGRLAEHVYPELRLMARRYMNNERQGNTLQTTALVHEVYLRLVDVTKVEWHQRAQFFAMAAQMMRRILVDAARVRSSQKRGGIALKVNLDETAHLSTAPDRSILALDEALTAFSQVAPRQAKVVELRYFGGLTEEEIVTALKISLRTVRRDWTLARAWLLRELSHTVREPSGGRHDPESFPAN